MTDREDDVLTGFVGEFHRALDTEAQAAAAIATRCWLAPLREALRGFEEGADARFVSGARAADAVQRLLVDDDRWPLPTLLGGALLNLDAVTSLAGDELESLDGSTPEASAGALAHFQESFQGRRDSALRSALVDATLDLTQLVRALQSWQATLTLATAADSRDPEVQALVDEAEAEQASLVALLDELARNSPLGEFASALRQAVDDADADAREQTMRSEEKNGIGSLVRRRWSETQASALATLRRRRTEPVYARSVLWTAHHNGLWVRVDLQRRLLSLQAVIRERLEQGLDALEAQSVLPIREHLGGVTTALRTAQAEAKARSEGASQSDWAAGAKLVDELHATTSTALAQALQALAELPLAEAARTVSDDCVEGCVQALGELPERVEAVELETTEPDDWPLSAGAILTPREWAERAYDLDRMSALRAALLQVADAVGEGAEQAQKAPEILSYNLEAALDEMRLAATSGGTEEDPWHLVQTGLDRTGDFLDRIVESVGAAHQSARRMAGAEIDAGTIELLARIAQEDTWSAEVSDVWSDALARARRIGRGARRGGARTATATGRAASLAFGRARTALERARRMIGGGSSADASDETLRELSNLDAQSSALPFVYRRLFSPRPVEDPTLFVGREEHVEGVLRHWSDWKAGRRNTLVVTGTYGGGMRSLLTAVARASGEPSAWRRASLADRIDGEAALVGVLANATLDAKTAVGLETLDDLAAALAGADAGPIAVHVERFEHVFERTVEGFALAEQTLEFFSSTDTLAAWFVTMPSDAWGLLGTVSPSAAALALTHEVGPLDQDGLTEMLTARHQRSGLALEFDTTSAPQAALRDRKDKDAVEKAFFARFGELTDGSVPLALLYWVRSALYEPESEHVTLKWPEPLDFSFLEELSWDQAFALQAFVEHSTLRVADHARIFSTSTDRSYEVLESLGNLYLIEPATAVRRVGEQLSFTTVARGEPYRIRPVLLPVVRRLLKARHLTK